MELREWLESNKGQITHFRPRRWCGQEYLLAYNRRHDIPLIECPLIIHDTQENAELIRDVLGPGFIEEPHEAMPGSRNY